LGVLSEEILETDEFSRSFEEREPLAVQAANRRKNSVIRCTRQWSSGEEEAGESARRSAADRNEPEERVFISMSLIND